MKRPRIVFVRAARVHSGGCVVAMIRKRDTPERPKPHGTLSRSKAAIQYVNHSSLALSRPRTVHAAEGEVCACVCMPRRQGRVGE